MRSAVLLRADGSDFPAAIRGCGPGGGAAGAVECRRNRGRAGLDDAVIWFPLVGALLGTMAGAVRIVAEPLLGSTVASVLALLMLVASTGALHLDGLADAGVACGPLPGLAAIGAAVLTTALLTTWVRKTLGGRTGDTLGATISLTEPAIVLTLLAIWHN